MQLPEHIKKHYPFQSNFHTLDSGHRLHYLCEGQGPEIVLMVHGNPTWSFFYRNLIPEFSDNFRVIVPDHIGCGLSDKPRDYNFTLAQRIADLTSLLKTLQFSKIHLIVHDWGGPIGLGTAFNFHEKLASTTLFNTAAFHDTHIPWRINILRNPIIGKFLIDGHNLFARAATTMAVTHPLDPEIKDAFLFPYRDNALATYEFVRDIPLHHSHPSFKTLKSIESQLWRINNVDTKVIWGGKDFCFDDHYFNQWRNRLDKAEKHYLPQAGHYLLEDALGLVVGHL